MGSNTSKYEGYAAIEDNSNNRQVLAPKGWPENVQYTNVCIGEKYRAVPLKDNENKVEIREITGCKFYENIKDREFYKGNCYGVFATEKIYKREIIYEYTGIFCTDDEKNKNSKYLLRFPDNKLIKKCERRLCIDSELCGNSSRFINDYHNIALGPNVEFQWINDGTEYKYKGITFSGRIITRAKEDIMPEEQLLTTHGVGYCKKWGII